MTPRLVLVLVLLLAAVVFAVQNAALVVVHFLFWRFAISRALVVFLSVAIGFVAGVAVTARWWKRRGGRR